MFFPKNQRGYACAVTQANCYANICNLHVPYILHLSRHIHFTFYTTAPEMPTHLQHLMQHLAYFHKQKAANHIHIPKKKKAITLMKNLKETSLYK